MAWYDQDSWLTAAFSPNLTTIFITLIVALGLPIIVHAVLYRKAAAAAQIPTFLLVGPSGGGKTAFTTLAERKTTTQTHTSTTPLTVSAILPSPHVPASSHYRSPGDPAFERSRNFLLIDTPGHGKLRHYATAQINDPKNIRAIIFVVDSAQLSNETDLNEAAEYLHDILLSLQKRYTDATSSKGPKEIPVLVAANKLDLFTALPPHLVKDLLEKTITEVRSNKAKALRDAGAALSGGEDDVDEEKEWLGEGGEGSFTFEQMRESGTSVQVIGGNVVAGKEGADMDKWWEWIAEQL